MIQMMKVTKCMIREDLPIEQHPRQSLTYANYLDISSLSTQARQLKNYDSHGLEYQTRKEHTYKQGLSRYVKMSYSLQLPPNSRMMNNQKLRDFNDGVRSIDYTSLTVSDLANIIKTTK